MKKRSALAFAMLASGFVVGCGSSETSAPTAASVAPVGKDYLLATEPENAKEVLAAREDAKDGDEITLIGRIGGDTTPWVDGIAAFKVVDPTLKACSDIPGDNCPTPWDYCCEADLGQKTALVKIVGDDGKPVQTDARELLGVTELQTVVVTGKAQRDEAGNLTVLAEKVYVRPSGGSAGSGDHDHEGHDHGHDHDHEGHDHDVPEKA